MMKLRRITKVTQKSKLKPIVLLLNDLLEQFSLVYLGGATNFQDGKRERISTMKFHVYIENVPYVPTITLIVTDACQCR